MTRQNFYKEKKRRQVREVDVGLVVSLVRRERQMQPRLGGRKLLKVLSEDLREAGVEVGRDRLFTILRDNGLLVERLPRSTRTTYTQVSLPLFPNVVKDQELTGPHQAWVCDITYVRTLVGFLYVALITDLFSRKIVGYCCGDRLDSELCIPALQMAMDGLPADCFPVHHSDRGCQYRCESYIKRLTERGLPISMTEVNHCYENSHAERVNGILKQEYGLGTTFRSPEQVEHALRQAVWLYNCRRPHQSLKYRTPEDVHTTRAA